MSERIVKAYEVTVRGFPPVIYSARSPVRTKEYLAGQKAGFSMGLQAGKTIMQSALHAIKGNSDG